MFTSVNRSPSVSTKTVSPANPTNLQEVIDAIGNVPDLTEQRRQDMRSAVRSFARGLNRQPVQIPADIAAIKKQIAGLTAQMLGFTKPRWANVKSGVIAALSLTEAGIVAGKRRYPLDPEWDGLLAKVSDRYERARLSRFFSWCSKAGIAPTAVTQADVDRFAKALVTEMMAERPKAVHRDLALAWNRCRIGIAGWPVLEIDIPDNLRTYALPEDAFSEAFVADVNAYIKHQSVVDPFEDPPRKPLAPTTLRDLRLRIFQLGTALAEAGHDPKQFSGLRDLVAPAAAKAALSGQHHRNGGRKTGQLYNYAQTLIKIARHWVKLPEAEVEKLKTLGRAIKPEATGMTDKNRAVLRQFDNPQAVEQLIKLPQRVFDGLPASGRLRVEDCLRAQSALIVGILALVVPLRIKNIAGMRIGVDVVAHRAGAALANGCHIVLPAEEVKNRQDLEFPVAPMVAKMLEIYVNRCLPILGKTAAGFLFPNTSGRAKAAGSLGVQVKTFIKRETGLVINVHAFRHLAAKLYLERNPGDYATVQMLLGHKSLQTTLRAYVGLERRDATRRYDSMMMSLIERGLEHGA
jgi:integrase